MNKNKSVILMATMIFAVCTSNANTDDSISVEQSSESDTAPTEQTKSITETVFEKLPKEDYKGYVFRCATVPASWSEFLERNIIVEE